MNFIFGLIVFLSSFCDAQKRCYYCELSPDCGDRIGDVVECPGDCMEFTARTTELEQDGELTHVQHWGRSCVADTDFDPCSTLEMFLKQGGKYEKFNCTTCWHALCNLAVRSGSISAWLLFVAVVSVIVVRAV